MLSLNDLSFANDSPNATDPPLRILNSPTLQATETNATAAATTTAPKRTEPADKASKPTKQSNSAKAQDIQLVSDGWTQREGTSQDASDNVEQIGSGLMAKPEASQTRTGASVNASTASPVSAAADHALDPHSEPKSTLNFILPRQGWPADEPQSPAKSSEPAPATTSALPERLASELYGPGDNPVMPLLPARSTATEQPLSERRSSPEAPAKLPSESLSSRAAKDSTRSDSATAEASTRSAAPGRSEVARQPQAASPQIADPEQNEPYYGEALPQEPDASDSSQPMAESEESLTLEPYDSSPDASEPEPIPQRPEVRDLKLGSDGSLQGSNDNKSRSPLQADPISRRGEASRQSITDGELPATPEASGNRRDSINAAGELKLSLGLPSQLTISATAARLQAPLERTLNYYWVRPENAAERTHWGMFHQIMIFDKDTQILHQKQQYNAVAWMAGNNPCRNQLLYDRDQHGIVVKEGVGLQGHQAQMLAVFGLIDVPANYPIYVAKQKFTVNDVIEREKKACKAGSELTFTLIGLAHYIDTDTRWTCFAGEEWSFDRLIQEELAQPVVGAACGGTHRLMGFAHALRRRRPKANQSPVSGPEPTSMCVTLSNTPGNCRTATAR